MVFKLEESIQMKGPENEQTSHDQPSLQENSGFEQTQQMPLLMQNISENTTKNEQNCENDETLKEEKTHRPSIP